MQESIRCNFLRTQSYILLVSRRRCAQSSLTVWPTVASWPYLDWHIPSANESKQPNELTHYM